MTQCPTRLNGLSRFAWCVGALALLVTWTGCTARLPRAQILGTGGDRLTVYVSLETTTPLPADAELQLWLADAASTSTRIAEGSLAATGRVWPLRLRLRYDDDRIDEDHTYLVKAAIRSGDRVLYNTPADTLVITRGQTHEPRLTLRPVEMISAPTPSVASNGLAGTSWRLEALAGTPVLIGADVTLEFLDQTRVAGSGSCNRFTGTAKVSGNSISFSPVAATQMACSEPVMAQEGQYFKALAAAERFTLEGGSLVIFSKDLPNPLRFVRRPIAPEVVPPSGN